MRQGIIILLLIMAGVAGAQQVVKCDEFKIYYQPVCTLRVDGRYYGNPGNTFKPKPDTLAYRTHQITVGDLEKFLADSTTMDSIPSGWVRIGESNNNGMFKIKREYVHRQWPKTLSGLLAWIKNKHKEER